jgi:ABC-type branched-subunit amino acid transport system substrate-binding protein
MGTPPVPSPARDPALPQPFWKRVLQWRSVRILKNFVVLPLIGALIAGMIIGRVANAFIGPKTYFVYVVGDESDKSTQELLKAAAPAGGYRSALDSAISVQIETRNDFGDPDKAQTIAQELVRRSDVLMVVGHVYSTPTQRALPIYLQADPPIPVILTTETNPGLLPPPAPTDDRVPPVFRLFPTDDNQAKVAADFIATQKAKSVWVVEDTSNPTYSQYLARTFLNAVYDDQPSLKVVLWSTNLNLPPYAVDKLGIDWVFFAGDWRNGLVLIRQLQAMPGTKNARVLLSDASVDKLLLKYGGADVEGVYLLHPLSADVFNKDGYAVVGQDAYGLTSALIDSAREDFDGLAAKGAPWGYRLRKWLGLRRVSDARRAIAGVMTTAVNIQRPFILSDTTVTMGRDQNRAIIRKDASFHVWRIDHNNFVQIR